MRVSAYAFRHWSMATVITASFRLSWALREDGFDSSAFGQNIMRQTLATYDSNSYLSFSDLGIDPQLDDEAVVDLPEAERATFASISFNPHEIEDSVIAEMCEHAPAFVDQEPTLTFRKSAEPKAILEIAASLWLLCQNPFLKKFLERYGERSADASLVFLSWLKTEVFPRLTRSARDPLFVLHFAHKDCRVEFIVPSNDVIVLASASESVHTAIPSAVMVVEKLAHLRVERVVYEYHVTSARWLPRFAVTQYGGILSDRRWLIALDRLAASLSIGARQKPGAD